MRLFRTRLSSFAPCLAFAAGGLLVGCGDDASTDDFGTSTGLTGMANGAATTTTGTTGTGTTGTTGTSTGGDAGLTATTGFSTGFDGGLTADGGLDEGGAASDGGTGEASVDSGPPEPQYPGLEGTPFTPLETDGEPLEAEPFEWTYIEFADTQCRDGSPAGLALSLNPDSTKVMIYFEGGGACFDGVTCAANPASVGSQSDEKTGGVFDRENDENPFQDWNFVYLPYCTGDVFAGTRSDVQLAGSSQQFVGYLNVRTFLNRLSPTFPDATEVVVTGISAGGFGASANVVQIQRAFPDVKGKLINDSGPPMGGEVLAPCLQEIWRENWGLEDSMLADCGDACPDENDYTADYGRFLAATFDNRLSGLIEAAEDSIIAGFFGAGTDPIGFGPCTGTALVNPVPGSEFREGLLDFRESVLEYENFGTWIPDDTQHTWLGGESFYTGSIGDERLVDWVSDIVNDVGTAHVGP